MTRAEDMAASPAEMSLSNLWWAAHNPPADPSTSFHGKVVLVTGANTGLGYEAALKFAKLGAARLILGVRSLEKGQEAQSKLAAAVGPDFDPNAISFHELDMLSYDSIRQFVNQVSAQYLEIHIAVLNAGMGAIKHALSPQGYEMCVQVNGISTAYVALLLLPKLRQTAHASGTPAVLEIVASTGHAGATPEMITADQGSSLLRHISEERNFSLATYGVSKLLNMWTMTQLAVRVPAQEVTILAVCPGLCKSDMARDAPWVVRKLDGLWKNVFGRTAEEGGRTLVSGTTVGTSSHGAFWTNDRISVPGTMVTSPEGKDLSDKFWLEIIDIFKGESSEVTKWA